MNKREGNRCAEIVRNTRETQITLKLNLDGSGLCTINTGVGFLDHMLTLFASHGNFDLEIQCVGDTQVDDHHSVEDIGICLGMAFAEALGACQESIDTEISSCRWMKPLSCAPRTYRDAATWNMIWQFQQKRSELLILNWCANFSLLLSAKPELLCISNSFRA